MLPFRHRHSERGQSVVEFALVVPLMIVVLFAIIDFARVYTTMTTVESAAREAADFGTTLGAKRWITGLDAETEKQMKYRACVASRNLPDYDDPDKDPETGCANPLFEYCFAPSAANTCSPSYPPPLMPTGCDDDLRVSPCTITVKLTHQFHLIAPFRIEVLGSTFGFPATIPVTRDSTFAMTDIDLSSPAPPVVTP